MKKHGIFTIIFAALALATIGVLSSCSSDDNSTGSNGNTGNPPPANEVYIQGFAFNPANLTVTAGTTVTWTNKDGAAHTVTSDNGAFTSSGNLAANDTYQYTFMNAGAYPYHCSIHPAMKGTITVTP